MIKLGVHFIRQVIPSWLIYFASKEVKDCHFSALQGLDVRPEQFSSYDALNTRRREVFVTSDTQVLREEILVEMRFHCPRIHFDRNMVGAQIKLSRQLLRQQAQRVVKLVHVPHQVSFTTLAPWKWDHRQAPMCSGHFQVSETTVLLHILSFQLGSPCLPQGSPCGLPAGNYSSSVP